MTKRFVIAAYFLTLVLANAVGLGGIGHAAHGTGHFSPGQLGMAQSDAPAQSNQDAMACCAATLGQCGVEAIRQDECGFVRSVYVSRSVPPLQDEMASLADPAVEPRPPRV